MLVDFATQPQQEEKVLLAAMFAEVAAAKRADAFANEDKNRHAHLSDEDLREFREIFNLVDTDLGGTIGIEELAKLMHTLGIQTTQEELKLMVSEIDENGNGEIDFDEFVQVMSRKVATDYSASDVRQAFRTFAGDAPDGSIRFKDLERALQTYGREKLTTEEAKNLLSQVECHGGVFRYEEYIRMMMMD